MVNIQTAYARMTKSEQLRRKLESAKGDYFSHTIISDFLYGAEDGSELDRSMDEIRDHNILRSWTHSQWAALLSKYVFWSYSSSILPHNGCRFYLEQPSVVILGKPSAKLADNLEESEKARIANQVEKLGPKGLKEVEQKLETAKENQSKPIPTDTLTSFPVPDAKSIFRIPVQSVQEPGMGRKANLHVVPTNGELLKHIESDGMPLPFFVEYDHVEVYKLYLHSILFLKTSPHSPTLLVSMHISHWLSCPITFVLICSPTSLPFSLSQLCGTMGRDWHMKTPSIN